MEHHMLIKWWLMSCITSYCVGNKTALHFILMYRAGNQRKPEFISEYVPSSFAKLWNREPYMPAIVVSRISANGICSYSKNFGNPLLLKSMGIFVTYQSPNICSNPDPSNSSILLSNFQLSTESYMLSEETIVKITNLIECCQAYCMAVALSFSKEDEKKLKSQEHMLLLATSGNSDNIQPIRNTSNNNTLTFLSKNSIFFVAVSFIVLMIISLGWLAFYYVERFRNAHTKEYISKRIAKAAKKALAKMPIKTVRDNGSDDLNYQSQQCTVCIEPFRPNDTIRILPCKHVYHKVCIDPWLIENHTCPVCKLDILTASGFELPYGRFNCDLEPVVPMRSLELYPVPLDLLLSGDAVDPPGSSLSMSSNGGNGGSDQDIQLVHIRPPVVQVHNSNVYGHMNGSRRSSTSSCQSSSKPLAAESPVEESVGQDDETRRLLAADGTSSSGCNNHQQQHSSWKQRHSTKPCSVAASSNMACCVTVDVIAPATPPVESVAVTHSCSKNSNGVQSSSNAAS